MSLVKVTFSLRQQMYLVRVNNNIKQAKRIANNHIEMIHQKEQTLPHCKAPSSRYTPAVGKKEATSDNWFRAFC